MKHGHDWAFTARSGPGSGGRSVCSASPQGSLKNPAHRETGVSGAGEKPLCSWAALAPTRPGRPTAEVFVRRTSSGFAETVHPTWEAPRTVCTEPGPRQGEPSGPSPLCLRSPRFSADSQSPLTPCRSPFRSITPDSCPDGHRDRRRCQGLRSGIWPVFRRTAEAASVRGRWGNWVIRSPVGAARARGPGDIRRGRAWPARQSGAEGPGAARRDRWERPLTTWAKLVPPSCRGSIQPGAPAPAGGSSHCP
jgi:hypothetical protein